MGSAGLRNTNGSEMYIYWECEWTYLSKLIVFGLHFKV